MQSNPQIEQVTDIVQLFHNNKNSVGRLSIILHK